MRIRDRLELLYLADTGPTKAWSVWVLVLASIGTMLRANDGTQDVGLLLYVMPAWVWTLILLYIAVSRLVALLWWSGTVVTRLLTPSLSIVLWCFFFASQYVAPHFGLGLLFLVPALQETWILSRVIHDEDIKWTRKT